MFESVFMFSFINHNFTIWHVWIVVSDLVSLHSLAMFVLVFNDLNFLD